MTETKPRIWTKEQYFLLFACALAFGGEWKVNDNVCTIWNSNSIETERCKLIYNVLCESAKSLNIPAPKSWEAVRQQLQWAITSQRFENSGMKVLADHSRSRYYAVASGWISPETASVLNRMNFAIDE